MTILEPFCLSFQLGVCMLVYTRLFVTMHKFAFFHNFKKFLWKFLLYFRGEKFFFKPTLFRQHCNMNLLYQEKLEAIFNLKFPLKIVLHHGAFWILKLEIFLMTLKICCHFSMTNWLCSNIMIKFNFL